MQESLSATVRLKRHSVSAGVVAYSIDQIVGFWTSASYTAFQAHSDFPVRVIQRSQLTVRVTQGSKLSQIQTLAMLAVLRSVSRVLQQTQRAQAHGEFFTEKERIRTSSSRAHTHTHIAPPAAAADEGLGMPRLHAFRGSTPTYP